MLLGRLKETCHTISALVKLSTSAVSENADGCHLLLRGWSSMASLHTQASGVTVWKYSFVSRCSALFHPLQLKPNCVSARRSSLGFANTVCTLLWSQCCYQQHGCGDGLCFSCEPPRVRENHPHSAHKTETIGSV
ncbi:MAG: uncharacterized protein A8A55_1905 [Amphiamblys sp. WSBS2006]|nr:MAG: uncharacterized protein A8A55_1905 [Amphiamblys sp. WSBS2006]